MPYHRFNGIALEKTDVQAVVRFCTLYIATQAAFCARKSDSHVSADEHTCQPAIQFQQCCDLSLYSSVYATVQVLYCFLSFLCYENEITGTSDKRCCSR
jgi:hypothetical protein